VNAAEDALEWNPYVIASATAPILTIQNNTDDAVDAVLRLAAGATPVTIWTLGLKNTDGNKLALCYSDSLAPSESFYNIFEVTPAYDDGGWIPAAFKLTASLNVYLPNEAGAIDFWGLGFGGGANFHLVEYSISLSSIHEVAASYFGLESFQTYAEAKLSANLDTCFIDMIAEVDPPTTRFESIAGTWVHHGPLDITPFLYEGELGEETATLRLRTLNASSKYIGFRAPDAAAAADVIWMLPDADAEGFLKSDGAGVLSFTTPIVDADFANTPDSGDTDTDDLIDKLRNALITLNLIASA
jgi:hypothetical protein